MGNETTIRRSPIVLVLKFAAVEAAGGLLYFLATLLGNAKYELYSQLSFSNFLSYQVAKMLFLSAAQFALTVYVFLSWYYESYTIRPGSIIYKHGVFKKKEEDFPLDNSATFILAQNFVGKLFHYGSIRMKIGR